MILNFTIENKSPTKDLVNTERENFIVTPRLAPYLYYYYYYYLLENARKSHLHTQATKEPCKSNHRVCEKNFTRVNINIIIIVHQNTKFLLKLMFPIVRVQRSSKLFDTTPYSLPFVPDKETTIDKYPMMSSGIRVL